MTVIAFMNFHSPGWFILIPVLVLAFFMALRRMPPTLLVSNVQPFKKASAGGLSSLVYLHPVHWPKYLLAAGTLFFIVALARPQVEIEHRSVEIEGIDIMLVLDLSGSMRYLYDGVEEEYTETTLSSTPSALGIRSRIETAQRELTRFVEMRGKDRIGLIAFARTPYIVSPLTYDHRFILDQLRGLDQIHLPDGTEIAAPIVSAVGRLKGEGDGDEGKGRVIVLFSDGEDNVPFDISPRQAARLAAESGVIIHTVGIGGGRTFSLRNTLAGMVLQPVTETYDQDLLEDMAEITGGHFFAAECEEGLAQVVDRIDELTVGEFERPVWYEYREVFLFWALTGWLLIIVGLFLEHTVCRIRP